MPARSTTTELHVRSERGPTRKRQRAAEPAAPRPSPGPIEPPTEPGAATRLLWIGLVLLTLVRGAVAFVPGSWGWGLDVVRHVAPALGWTLWGLAAVTCIPAVARRGSWLIEWTAAALGRRGRFVTIGFVAGAAALVWALPDRTWFLGDFILRLGALERREPFERIFPQAMPLDVLLHGRLPDILALRSGDEIHRFNRLLGAIEAAAVAAFAASYAHFLGARGAAAVAIAATVFGGGFLTVFTGFGKTAAELCLATLALGVFGVASVRHRGALLPANLAVAVALALHRSAVLLLPALIVVWAIWWRHHGRHGAWRTPMALAALALPLVTLAWIGPRIVRLLASFDFDTHVVPIGIQAGGGPLAAAFAPLHLLDLVQLLVALSPLILLLPAVAAVRTGRLAMWREGLVPIVLALSFVPALLFAHPQQGVFRDWDVFAPAGVAASLVVGWMLADVLESRPGRAWLVAPLVLASLVPSILWLAHHHDTERGLARARAIAIGPPVRAADRSSQVWDYVGVRTFRLGRWQDSAEAFSRSAALVPHPRVLRSWALSATFAEDYVTAGRAYRTLLGRDPEDPVAWLGLAGVTIRVGDSTGTREALARLARYSDEPAALARMESYLRVYPQIWPYPLRGIHRP